MVRILKPKGYGSHYGPTCGEAQDALHDVGVHRYSSLRYSGDSHAFGSQQEGSDITPAVQHRVGPEARFGGNNCYVGGSEEAKVL